MGIATGKGTAPLFLIPACIDFTEGWVHDTHAPKLAGQYRRNALLGLLLSMAQRDPQLTPELRKRLMALSLHCLRSGREELIAAALQEFFKLDVQPTSEQLTAIATALPFIKKDSGRDIAIEALAGTSIPIGAYRSAVLRTKDNLSRAAYLKSLRVEDKPKTIQIFTEALKDPVFVVRAAACKALARRVDRNAIPTLIETLKDKNSEVRTAAHEALQSIRFYHEQGSYWQGAEGPDLSAKHAAQKLILLADAKQTKAVRLDAIRALGALGLAETLPFLITYQSDADVEIAAAAAEAKRATYQKAAATMQRK